MGNCSPKEIKSSSGSKRQVSVGNLISAGLWRLHFGGPKPHYIEIGVDGLVPNQDDVDGLQPPCHSACPLGEPESLELHVPDSLDARVFPFNEWAAICVLGCGRQKNLTDQKSVYTCMCTTNF